MYLNRRMQSGGYAVYRQGLAEVLQLYNNKVERKTSLSPFPTIDRFGREYNNQMTPQGLKLSSNPLVNAGNHFSNGSNNSKMQRSPPNRWFNFPSWGRWVIGSAISLVLSFWNNERMQKLKRIEGSEYISIISLILSLVLEYISEAASHEAHLTQDFLHKDAISVSRNIIKNPKLVPGGRATKLTATLKQKSATIEGIEKWPYEATAIAFEAIPRTLAQNCGVNVSEQ